jgi:hypothetical protein
VNFESLITQKPVLIFMGALLTVTVCCLASQCLVRLSKNYNLQLNKYYSKKRYEKAKMIQNYLNQEEQLKNGGGGSLDNSLIKRNRMNSSSSSFAQMDEQTMLKEQERVGSAI